LDSHLMKILCEIRPLDFHFGFFFALPVPNLALGRLNSFISNSAPVVETRLRNKQLSRAQKVQINLIDYLFEPSNFLLKFNSYLGR
jgi:hypothetical protein